MDERDNVLDELAKSPSLESKPVDLYNFRKSQGMCVECGKVVAEAGCIRCKTCREKRNRYNREYRKKSKCRITPMYVREMSISDICREAKKHGLSYGMMVAKLEGRIK